jgi:hypothetical protein
MRNGRWKQRVGGLGAGLLLWGMTAGCGAVARAVLPPVPAECLIPAPTLEELVACREILCTGWRVLREEDPAPCLIP